jgi:NAD(P)-dependent dehydrogenase (short-subunit alcohol dehydrogenase family)
VRIAVVTGASRGLGRSMAQHLARAGWGVVGTYRSSRDGADAVVGEIEAGGGRAAMLPFDATDPASIDGFVAELRRTLRASFGRDDVDALVNNAGVGLNAPFAETTEEQFDRLVAINLTTPFFLAQRMLPHIVDGGRIVNISSGLARFTLPGNSAYAATKGAIEVLTRYQAQELGPRGIRVNVVVPGAIETDFNGGAVRDNPDYHRAVASMTALGRPGRAEDIGAAVAALLSDDFGWASGSRIELSGGQRL